MTRWVTKWQALALVTLFFMVATLATGVYEALEGRWAACAINFCAAFVLHIFAGWVMHKHQEEVRRREKQDGKWWRQ